MTIVSLDLTPRLECPGRSIVTVRKEVRYG